jgi:hypothetical protein
MTRPHPIPCGTLVRHADATWTVRARALTHGEQRYWLSNAEGDVVGPLDAAEVSRLTTSETGLLARALRRMGAR